MTEQQAMIRCNNCMQEFKCDDDLERIELPDKEIGNGCPKCRTDAYLMDMEGWNDTNTMG